MSAVFLGLFYWLARRAESLYNLLVFPYFPTLLFPPHATSCIYSQYIRSSHSHRPRALPGAYLQSIGLAPLHKLPLEGIKK